MSHDSPTLLIFDQLCLADLFHRRTKVRFIFIHQRHLVCSALQVSLEDNLAVQVNHEVIRVPVKKLFGVVDEMLVDWQRVSHEDSKRIPSTPSGTSSLLPLTMAVL